MASVIWDSVEGIGVAAANELTQEMIFFAEAAVWETVELPDHNPNMEQLLAVMAEIEVLSERLVKTPVSTSYEGQCLMGCKLILELKLKQKIRYAAQEPVQSVHAAEFERLLNSISVILPENICSIPVEILYKGKRLIVAPYIEDIYAAQLSSRRIFTSSMILIDVKPNL